MDETTERAASSTFEKANAAWIEYKNQIRFNEFCSRLFEQDHNLEEALRELDELKRFVADPGHILGSDLTKHGEIAEHVQVNISNARKLIDGFNGEYTFEGVGRTAPEDYLKNGMPVQSKFCNGVKNTLFAIKSHYEDYPDFISNGGSYDIPNNQYKEIHDLLRRSKVNPSSLNKSEWSVLDAVKEFEKDSGLSVYSDLKPSVVDYDQVQLDRVEITINNEETSIHQKDVEKRELAQKETGPSIKEGAKVAGISAGAEGGIMFCLCVYRKIHSGKKIQEFDKDDWIEIAKETGFGVLKGGIRGTSVYVLTNFTKTPANLASAYTTATIGVASQFVSLQRGAITMDDFIQNSEIMCLDIAVSTVSAQLGQKLIPIPVLGSVIGTVVGETLFGLCKKYADEEETKLVEQMNADLADYVSGLDGELQRHVERINTELRQFEDMSALAFDPDPNCALFGSANLASLSGVPREKILWTPEDVDNLFLK